MQTVSCFQSSRPRYIALSSSFLAFFALHYNTLCSKKSDAKLQITITTAHLIRIKYPLNSLNYHLSDVNVANFNKIHRTIKATKRIFNSDKICRSNSDLNFGVTFLEHSVLYIKVRLRCAVGPLVNSGSPLLTGRLSLTEWSKVVRNCMEIPESLFIYVFHIFVYCIYDVVRVDNVIYKNYRYNRIFLYIRYVCRNHWRMFLEISFWWQHSTIAASLLIRAVEMGCKNLGFRFLKT